MTIDDLAAKVRWMRTCQRSWDREQTDRALHAAKEAESAVDRILDQLARGPDLFDGWPHGEGR